MGWLSDYAAAKSIDVDMTPDRSIEQRAVDEIAERTEDMCRQAIRNGPDWRVWRSSIDLKQNPETLQWRHFYSLRMLPPGVSVPGSGTVYGPWPAGFQDMDNEERTRLVMTLPTPDHDTDEFDTAMDDLSSVRSPMGERLNGWRRTVGEDRRGYFWVVTPDFPKDPQIVQVWGGIVRPIGGSAWPPTTVDQCGDWLWNGPIPTPALPEYPAPEFYDPLDEDDDDV